MKKANSRKVLLFFLVLLFVSITIGCGSTQPDIEGLWKADNWEGEYIEISSNRNYYRFMKSANIENRDFFDEGICHLTKQDDRDCLMLQSNPESDIESTYEWYAVEFVSDDHMILYTDQDFKNEQCLDTNAEANTEKINLRRIE